MPGPTNTEPKKRKMDTNSQRSYAKSLQKKIPLDELDLEQTRCQICPKIHREESEFSTRAKHITEQHAHLYQVKELERILAIAEALENKKEMKSGSSRSRHK